MDRVVAEQKGHSLDRAQVVDGDELQVSAPGPSGPEEVAADPAKSVDTDTDGHGRCCLLRQKRR